MEGAASGGWAPLPLRCRRTKQQEARLQQALPPAKAGVPRKGTLPCSSDPPPSSPPCQLFLRQGKWLCSIGGPPPITAPLPLPPPQGGFAEQKATGCMPVPSIAAHGSPSSRVVCLCGSDSGGAAQTGRAPSCQEDVGASPCVPGEAEPDLGLSEGVAEGSPLGCGVHSTPPGGGCRMLRSQQAPGQTTSVLPQLGGGGTQCTAPAACTQGCPRAPFTPRSAGSFHCVPQYHQYSPDNDAAQRGTQGTQSPGHHWAGCEAAESASVPGAQALSAAGLPKVTDAGKAITRRGAWGSVPGTCTGVPVRQILEETGQQRAPNGITRATAL